MSPARTPWPVVLTLHPRGVGRVCDPPGERAVLLVHAVLTKREGATRHNSESFKRRPDVRRGYMCVSSVSPDIITAVLC